MWLRVLGCYLGFWAYGVGCLGFAFRVLGFGIGFGV